MHKLKIKTESKEMDNFDLNELMELAEACVGPVIDATYCRLMDWDFALEDPELVMLLLYLINILGHDNRGDRSRKSYCWLHVDNRYY